MTGKVTDTSSDRFPLPRPEADPSFVIAAFVTFRVQIRAYVAKNG
ncbi:hypothetical protein [Bifidobacterium sp.]